MKITRKGKRILSLLLAIVLLVSMIPNSVVPVSSQEVTQQDSHPNIGKLAKIVSFTSGRAYLDPANAANYTIVSSAYYPKRVEIKAVKEVNGTTYYQLSAAKNYEWPSYGPGDGYWLDSANVAIIQICDKCGAEDCEKVHVFCPYCDTYDCPLEHNDPYQPYVAPVIPANPTLTPGADVSLADEFGNAVTESIVVNAGTKYSLSAWPKLSGNVTYQWQVCYNNAKMLWVDLYGQTEKGILLSAAMIRSLVDAQGLTYLRCVTTSGSQTMTSDPIPVILDETSQKNITVSDVRYADGGADGAQTVEDEVKYAVTIKYEVKNTGAEPPEAAYVVYLTPGSNYVLDVVPAPMPGYYTGDATGAPIERVTRTITDIQAPIDITVYYWPDYVDYEVHHYQQRIGEDKYDLVATDIFDRNSIGRKKTGDPVGADLAKTTYIGFDILPYDTSITVAADGSTVVNIYYDRQYFMIALDLAGGYGAEPIYARYETPISIPNPKRTGYTFVGWENLNTGKEETIVETMPVIPEAQNFRITYRAIWAKADTKFTVAFWYEDANPEADGTYHYTFVGSVQLDGKTDDVVSGSAYAWLNELSSAEHFDGFNADHAQHFTTLNADKTDKNITIKADGSTVVNVYFIRNSYELTYNHWVCLHQHTSSCCAIEYHAHTTACCNKQHIHNEKNQGECCTKENHTHTLDDCIGNNVGEAVGKATDKDYINKCNSLCPNPKDGDLCSFQEKNWLGQTVTRYFVYFGGSWYRRNTGNTNSIVWNKDCPRYTHTHGDGSCNTEKCKTTAHDHSSGLQSSCNTAICGNKTVHTHTANCDYSACTHKAGYPCESDTSNPNHWKATTYSVKYGADVSAIHKQMEEKTYGWRWVDMYFGGNATGENYGSGGAVGTFCSMPGGKTVFYQSNYNTSSTLYEMQYWLETWDGDVSGTRFFDPDGDGEGQWFKKQGEPFYTRMSYVAWNGDYVQGLPAGFEVLDATFGDTPDPGGVNDPYGNSLYNAVGSNYTQRSYKKYNNYYYVREKFRLVYKNGSETVAETTLMFEQPLTEAHNIPLPENVVSPYGAGYEFGGWYLDPECTVEVDWNNTKMPDGGNTGDIGLAVYAKWVPILHEVKTYLTKEDIGKTPINTYEIYHEEMYDGTVAVPKNGDLSFIGWFYEEDGKEVAYDFSMPVYRNMNLYAKWSSSVVTHGTIYYVDTDGNELASHITVTGMVGDTKTFNAKFSSELKGVGDKLYFPQVTSHSIKFAANPDQNTFTFVYTALPEVKYTIKFVNKDNPNEKIYPDFDGTATTATIVYNALEKNPPKDKWYLDKNSKEFALSSDEKENVFYFYYTYDPGKANVRVEHYIEKLESTDASNPDNYDFSFDTPATLEELETVIVAADRKATINGFTYKFATFNDKMDDDGKYTLNGGLTIKLYYSRNSYDYTFRFVYKDKDENEVEFANSAVKGTAKYRDNIIQGAKSFPGYEADSGAKSIIIDYTASNNIYTFYYTEKGVDIRYSVGAVKGGSINIDRETVSAITGKPVGSTATVKSGLYTFTGWYTDYNCTEVNRVSTSETYKPSQSEAGIFESRTYYAGFKEVKATIRYEVVMPDGATIDATLLQGSEQVDIVTGIANGTAVDTIPEGYAFDGWYDANGNLLSKELSFKPNRPADGWAATQTFRAKFVKLHTITWDYGYNGITDTTELVHGSIVLAPDRDPVRDGYTFLGWFTDAGFTTKYVFGQELTQDVTLYAKWERSLTTLTIDVVYPNGADYAIDGDHAFLFEVIGVDDGVNLTVAILKDGKAVIDGLTIDKVYTVKWDAAWSWRYSIKQGTDIESNKTISAAEVTGNTVTFTLGEDGVLTFTLTRDTDQWLDGNDYYSSN